MWCVIFVGTGAVKTQILVMQNWRTNLQLKIGTVPGKQTTTPRVEVNLPREVMKSWYLKVVCILSSLSQWLSPVMSYITPWRVSKLLSISEMILFTVPLYQSSLGICDGHPTPQCQFVPSFSQTACSDLLGELQLASLASCNLPLWQVAVCLFGMDWDLFLSFAWTQHPC